MEDQNTLKVSNKGGLQCNEVRIYKIRSMLIIRSVYFILNCLLVCARVPTMSGMQMNTKPYGIAIHGCVDGYAMPVMPEL